MELVHKAYQDFRRGRVDQGDFREIEHEDLGMLTDTVEDRTDAGGRAEEERSRDPIDERVAIQSIGAISGPGCTARIGHVFSDEGDPGLNLDGFGHAVQKYEGTEGDPDPDG